MFGYIHREDALMESLERQMLEAADLFAKRPELDQHLGWACVMSLKKRFSRPVITDAFQKDRTLSAGMLLAAGLALAAWLKRHVPDPRIAIVLPPGLGSTLANLATVLADKVPVNVNFTAGPAAVSSILEKAQLKTALTSKILVDRLKDEFPWPANRLNMEDVLGNIGRVAVMRWWLMAKVMAPERLAHWAGVPKQGGDREAALLFTSGSSGEPKGVVLTHRNIVGNVVQVRDTLGFHADEALLGCLPTFHSFGFTVQIWYPLLGGPRVVTYISPLEPATLAQIIERHKIQLVILTPTFMRGFMRKAYREQLRFVKLVVTGAEKLPQDLAQSFEKKFHVPVREGYGLTETSPVVSVNLVHEEACRAGSVGRMVPGMAVRIADPESGTPKRLGQVGMLMFKGINVFAGYLGEPERTAEVLKDGWFRSGDLGRLDRDGFLFIEGRLSRFSKVAGEMVPHGTVENVLQDELGGGGSEELAFAVMSRPCPERGEELVVLTACEVTHSELVAVMHRRGMPNLWVPRKIVKVKAIPVLTSGKLDLRKCQKLADEAPH
jgi:acyl-[acyl-carrier-protein]-phospholipid O-acyltransferase/long-chain-fatty-acid--[acyl-carrier-protein] ligase